MAKRLSLKDYLADPANTQVALAKAVGVTQGAIFQMLRAERAIFVIEHPDGRIELEEIKRIAGNAA